VAAFRAAGNVDACIALLHKAKAMLKAVELAERGF
jgi:hypothetical protein